MKKYVLLFWVTIFILPFLGIRVSVGQNPLVKQWDKRFGGGFQDFFYSMVQTMDGGFILGGSSGSNISGDKTQDVWGGRDYWIVKTDSLGNKLWERDFGGNNSDELSSIQQTNDGGYILGGRSSSGVGGDKTQPNWDPSGFTYDYWIVKIDVNGNKLWDKDFGGIDDDILSSVQQTNDGGYILGGDSKSGIGGDKTNICFGGIDYWIIKTDSVGNIQWNANFGGSGYDYFSSIHQTRDSGYVLGGSSNSGISGNKTQPNKGLTDFWIVKIDSLGIKKWEKDLGGSDGDDFSSLEQTSDGGYILGGLSISAIGGDKTQATWGSYDYWIIKIDSLGSKLWDKDFGGINNEGDFGNVSQTNDNGYLLSGISLSGISGDKTENNLGSSQTWLVKTDSFGIKQWDKTLHTNSLIQYDLEGFAIQTIDGCYCAANSTQGAIGGDKSQNTWGSWDYWIIKLCDTTSVLGTILQPLINKSPFVNIYPNPVYDKINLKFNYPFIKVQIQISNIFGLVVYESYNSSQEPSLDISTLTAGIYFIKFSYGNSQYIQKFIKTL